MDEIRFRKGRKTLAGLDPEQVLAGLEDVRRKNAGKLTPKAIIAAAESPSHPLHAAFEWDDAKAACRFRKLQARLMIRSVVIIRDETPPVPAYLSVTVEHNAKPERFYQHTDVIVEDEFVSAIRLLRRKFDEAAESLAGAKRVGERLRRSDVDMQTLVAIGEALATARAIAGRI